MTGSNEVDPRRLKEWLADGFEIAVLDVRDLGAFTRGHLWLAVNTPYARLELRVRRYVPRPATRMVLCDEDDGLARRAAEALKHMGYNNISILQGGVTGWRDSGFDLVDGNYVIAHSFGFFLKQHYQTPTIEAAELEAKIEAGEDLVILDSRPHEDHQLASLPGSISAPVAEVVQRIGDIAPNPETQIVVHCGGVTRGVLGAQSLILAGARNPIWFLQDGTKGWLAAGLTLQSGTIDLNHPISAMARSFASAAGKRMAEHYALNYITPEVLEDWRGEADQRTTYVIDVRSPEEYRSAHYPGALSVPGGELVGMTIDHLATRNARLCLIADEFSGRAEITATWMLHLGWLEVAILQAWDALTDLDSGSEPDWGATADQVNISSLSLDELAQRQKSQNPVVIDFAHSQSYEAAHIPGAGWMLRSNLPGAISKLPEADCYVVTSPKGRVAKLVAAEMTSMTNVPALVLSGGTEAWQAAGFDLLSGMQRPFSPIDDVDSVVAAPADGDPDAKQNIHARYNAWRRGLFDQYKKQGLSEFRIPVGGGG